MSEMSVSATDLRPGDVWVGRDEVTIDRVEPVTFVFDPRVRVFGTITKGYGKSRKVRSWTFNLDQRLEVRRG